MASSTATKATTSSKAAKGASEAAKATKANAAKLAASKPTGTGVKALAERLGTDGRTLRKWLRGQDLGVGFGGRYEFTTAQASKLAEAWQAEQQGEAE